MGPDRLARFQREAQVLASLNHPNIGGIHGIEEAEGARALVLELVDGPTLAERIAKGPIPLDEALPIAKQIAEALAAAHEQGVIHRDLKPANVKLRPDGTVKVLDFGLAKPIETRQSPLPTATTKVRGTDPRKVTIDGTILGTPSYMSPEQVRGQEVDQRTDIWAFGCCLYETLTSDIPFAGKTVPDVIAAVLEHEPDWSRFPESVPEPVRKLVCHCLAKGTRRRLRDAGDIVIALEDVSEAQTPRARASRIELESRIDRIAVLPFSEISGDSDRQWFGDAMTEQIILELAKVRALTVISRTSAMQYKGVVRSIPDIARELNVQAVVEGSVTRVGNDVRITAQLIQGATDGHLWAENYNGTLDHVLRFQSEIALAIAKAIQVTLTPEEETRIASVKETDPEAEQERIFDGWLEQRRGLFFKVVRAYAFNPDDQEDLFQEIATQVWNSAKKYRGDSAATTWIYRVALYAAIAWSKSERRNRDNHRTLEGEVSSSLLEPEMANLQLDWLYDQIAKLDEIDRSLTLLMFDGFSDREIGDTLGITEGNVGVKLTRIKQRLEHGPSS